MNLQATDNGSVRVRVRLPWAKGKPIKHLVISCAQLAGVNSAARYIWSVKTTEVSEDVK
jgi:hypothetical protein